MVAIRSERELKKIAESSSALSSGFRVVVADGPQAHQLERPGQLQSGLQPE